MDNSNQDELSLSQRYICNISAGAAIILCGIFLLLVGTSAIPLRLADIALPAVLFTLGTVFVTTAVVQKNSVSLWFSFFFIIPAIIVVLVAYVESLTYAKMYPFFIGIPAIASLFTIIISKEYRAHLSSAAFFGVLSLLFAFRSFGVASWGAVIPCIVIFCGAIILYLAVLDAKKKE